MKLILLFFFSILFYGCSGKHKFDKNGWREHTELMKYPNRNDMIEDLVKNYKLKGKKYTEIINLLGDPFPEFDFRKDTEMLYPIEMGFDKNGFMNHTKTLTLTITKDSIVQYYKVNEWKK